jgi:hypothetical protein
MLRGRRSGASFESPEGGKVIEHALELLVVESLGQRRDERLGLLGRLRAQVAERGDLELLQLLLREQVGGGDESDNGTDLPRTGGGRGGRVPAHFLHGSLGLVAAKPLHVRQGLEEHTAEGVWCEPHGGGREKRQRADVLGELGLSLLLHCSRLLSMLQKNGDLRVEQAVCILEI